MRAERRAARSAGGSAVVRCPGIADAEAVYRQVLDARQRILGPEHPDTLATRHNIARMVADQGRAADAEAVYRQVLDARQRTLGPEHPDTKKTADRLRRLVP